MKRFAPLALLGVVLLAGCTPAPNRADVVERAQIELGDSLLAGIPSTAEGIADDAFAGMCGSDAYRAQIADYNDVLYAFDVTCEHYFSHEMTEAQRERVRLAVMERALDGISED
jgi:hypothetical protein